jgi:hypothetical protein
MGILSFLVHTMSYQSDKEYKELYDMVSNRKTFFSHIFTFTTFFYISDWDSLWHIMLEGYIDGIHLD